MIFTCLTGLFLILSPGIAEAKSHQHCRIARCLRSLDHDKLREDCSAFLEKTVSPCPLTVISTATITVTRPKTTTILETALGVPSKTTLAVTLTTTVTLPATVATNPQPLKRAVANKACRAKTGSATAIPTYASTCSNGNERFSSACACLGVEANTITTERATSVSTTTKTATYVPVMTITVIGAAYSIPTDTKTSIASTTLGSSKTTGTTGISTSTTAGIASKCSQTALIIASGQNAGYYAVAGSSRDTRITFTQNPLAAMQFKLSSESGKIYTQDGGQVVGLGFDDYPTRPIDLFTLALEADSQRLVCTPSSTNPPSTLACASDHFGSMLQLCSGFLRIGPFIDTDAGCSAVTLGLVSLCSGGN